MRHLFITDSFNMYLVEEKHGEKFEREILKLNNKSCNVLNTFSMQSPCHKVYRQVMELEESLLLLEELQVRSTQMANPLPLVSMVSI